MKKVASIFLAVLMCIVVSGCGNANQYDETVFNLDYESEESQAMSSDRVSTSKLQSVFNWLDGQGDKLYDLTYKDVASWAGCHASTYSNLFGKRHYVWESDDQSTSLGVSCETIGGEWAVTGFSGNNLAT